MNTLRAFVKRHSFIAFVLLAYLLSWLVVIPTHGLLLPWGTMLAALIVVAFVDGRAGVRSLVSRVLSRGSGLRWYGLAVAFPVVITVTAAVVNILLFGAPIPLRFDWGAPARVLLMMLLVGGMWEEPGWTGYALPHLYERFAATRHGTLIATLILAGVRTGWHLPLMLSGHIYWSDIVSIVAAQIVYAWLFNRSRNSVLVVMLCHLTNNVIAGELVLQLFSGADWVRVFWLLAALWGLLAVGVLIFAGPNLARRASSTPVQAARASQLLTG